MKLLSDEQQRTNLSFKVSKKRTHIVSTLNTDNYKKRISERK